MPRERARTNIWPLCRTRGKQFWHYGFDALCLTELELLYPEAFFFLKD